MTVLEDYLKKCGEVIRSDDAAEADKLAREILVAFHEDIPHLSSYRGAGISVPGESASHHTVENIRQLAGKLLALQDRRDLELYGEVGLAEVTNAIRDCERYSYGLLDSVDAKSLRSELWDCYANQEGLEGFHCGLSNALYSGKEDDPEGDLRLIAKKLRLYRDSELRKQRIAESGSHNFSLNQEMHNNISNNVNISISQAVDIVNGISTNELSDDEKMTLKGMILDLEAAKESDEKKGEKLKNVLKWLVNKSVDAMVQMLPFLVQYAPTVFG